jgi:hypothetical protein
MTLPVRARSLLAVATLQALAIAFPPDVDGQLRAMVGKAESGVIYQILQHRAGDDLGVGIDEVRVTSVAANSFSASVCTSPPSTSTSALEAIASGPIGGARPIDHTFKSALIADASTPCFASSAVDGLGLVCIGPDCTPACNCAVEAQCQAFTMSDGIPLHTATPETPAAFVVAPLRVTQQHCSVANELTFGFGTANHMTTRSDVCGPAPADGLRLPATPSRFAGGVAGTTIVLAHVAMADEVVSVGAAGFGIDNDGQNPFGCDAPGRVVAAFEATGDEAPSQAPPLPPVNLGPDQRRCQKAIGQAARRFSDRVLRALQSCRDRILDGSWRIRADQCFAQRGVAKVVAAAARVSRSKIEARCAAIDLTELLTCGDRIDDLVGPDGESGCLFETHRNLAEQMAILQYGF